MVELAVVVPTFNERDNVIPMIQALEKALGDLSYEVIFVDDDSTDGTADLVRSIARENARVRVVQRIHRRGLSSATVEGMMASSAPYVAVIDGDLQHDETVLPQMLAKLKRDNLDLVAGTRNSEGGSKGEFARSRVWLSDLGRKLSRMVCKADLSDPMSGYFVLSRVFLNEVVRSLSNRGFKILLDLVASSRHPVRIGEVGYTFRNRQHGESKLDILVSLEYLELLADKLVGNWIPVSYLVFAGVGTVGLLVQLSMVYSLLRLTTLSFAQAQIASSSLAIASNFLLNNQLTFRTWRLKGRGFLRGIAGFYLACSIGLVSNWQAAEWIRAQGTPLYLASLGGLMVGSVWNYWVSSIFVWRVNRRRVTG